MMNKIEKIDKDIVALVITVDRGGMGAAEWSRQAQRNGEVFKKMFPDLKVIVISGDGACLMNLGSLVLHKRLNPPNLTHYIIDNNGYESTGGQPSCSFCVNFEKLAPNTKVIRESVGKHPRIPFSPQAIAERFRNAILCKQKK